MNKKSLLKFGLFTSFLSILTLSINAAAESKLYKWVDSQGRISYQGKPPPKNSKILKEEDLGQSKSSNSSGLKINTSPIDVYVTEDCSSCDRTVSFLKARKIPHQVKRIEDARDIQAILIEKTNGVRVPALFTSGQLIAKTSSNEDLKASLISTGHIDPEAKDPEETTEPDQEITPES